MKTYYIYIYISTDTQGNEYLERRYHTKKIKERDDLIYVGEAQLADDYFITGAETKYKEITSLSDISVEYTATLNNGQTTRFSHNLQNLLLRAKEGLLTYISFEGFKVRGYIVKIHGNKTLKDGTLKKS